MPDHATYQRSRVAELVVVGVLFVWSLYQSFWNLSSANLNADEPIYLTAGRAYLQGDFALNREHPPTAKYLLGFAQLILGEGELAGRIAVGVVVVLGGVVIFLWFRREIGWPFAAFAAAAWTLLPHGVSSGVRLDRFALLEPFMVFFAIAAFAAAWMWFRTRSWVWLIVSAVAMALSVTSKVSSAVLVPAILVLPLLDRRLRDALVGGVVFVAVFATAFVLLYAPMGIRSAITYMLEMQSQHNATGHSVVVAGAVYLHPPWWTNLLFSVEGMGVAATAVLLVGAVSALWRRPPALSIFLYSGVALLFVFYLVLSSVALTHYYYVWVWFLCALSGIGLSVLWNAAGRRRRVGRAVAVAMVVVAVASGAWTSATIAAERPRGMALVVEELDELDVGDGDILVGGLAEWEYAPYLDGRQVLSPADGDVVAVVTKDSVRFPLSDDVEVYLREYRTDLEPIVLDDVTLWVLEDEMAAGG
ncbi:glycosyltransferase family 39 protein [Herbiconiux liukaitaii]|uniref:glycosyltransferase family 39 protein n=1 Tax=Herbiconiux liukaitaii TaxID=3342799 RepID=UPI0035BA87E4